MESNHATLSVAIALAAGVLAQCISRIVRFPAIVALLALGVLLGPDVLNWVQPQTLGTSIYGLVDFGVAIILFEGGLNLQWSQIRKQERPIRRLVTIGALVTLFGGAAAFHFLLESSWRTALLFGSLVVVTGPTVVTPLLRDMRLQPRIKTILEAEGVLIDPVGVVLAVLVLQFVSAPTATTALQGLFSGASSFGFGLAAGLAAGFTLSHALRWRWLVPSGLEGIFTLGTIILLVPACDLMVPHSGILAVVVAGIVAGNRPLPGDRELREFKDQLTTLMVATLFVLLAADVRLEEVRALGWAGVAVVSALILVVRPLGVLLSTAKSDLEFRDRLFISWVAPRGIVAAAVASLTALAMEEAGLEGSSRLRALVFLTIAVTVLLAGISARPMASLLRLRLPARNRIAIVGADALGRRLGTLLRDHGMVSVLIDSDPIRCRQAEEDGLSVVFGDAIQERTMLRARFELVDTAVGLTSNEHLNRRFVRAAHELFRVPRGFVAQSVGRTDDVQSRVLAHAPDLMFEAPHDVERWDVRVRQGATEVGLFSYQPVPPPAPATAAAPANPSPAAPPAPIGGTQESHLVLLYVRQGKANIAAQAWKPKAGDLASVLIHRPDRAAAVAGLAQLGWTPFTPPATSAKAPVPASAPTSAKA